MSAFPGSLREPLIAALRQLGDHSAIRSARPVGGGCINNALRLETEKKLYLLKWNHDPLPGMFHCEALGLSALAATNTVRVPEVYAFEEAQSDVPAYILMEWLEGSGARDSARLGEQLAALHRSGVSPRTPAAYGLDYDNYLGSTRQVSGWDSDWARFFTRCRLQPQLELAAMNGRMTGGRRTLLERLIQRLPVLMGEVERSPSLIHGDLWAGNVIPGPDGFAVIDPAVSYSDREAEIAYTELFGGFDGRFYAAYQAAWPLDPGYPERRDLYNLYHLLNHLNLFGESYGGQVDRILRRYAG